jgi:hypothetical protein
MAPWGIIAERLVRAAGFDTNPVILKQLTQHSPDLGNLNERFISLWRSQNFDVITFKETRGMEGINGLNGKVICSDTSFFSLKRISADKYKGCRGFFFYYCR